MSTNNGGQAPEPGQGPSHRQIMVIFSGLLLSMLLASLDQTIVATALPTVAGTLGGFDQLSWVVTAYMLAATASTPLWGKIGDMRGRKQVLLAAVVVFLVGSAACGLAQDMGQLIAFRALQGIGAGGLMAMSMAVVADIVPPRERGRYQGYIQGVFALASIVGPLLGGYFAEHLTWRWIFYVNLPLGAIALVVLAVVLRIPAQRSPHRVDYAGAALLVGAVCALLLITVWGGQEYAWASWQILALAVATVVLFALFVRQERRAAEPILPPRLMKDRVVVCVSAGLFATTCVFFAATVFLPLYLQIVKDQGATESGLLLLPMLLTGLAATTVSGRVITKTGRYKIYPVIGMALMTVAMLLFATLDRDSSTLTVTLYMMLMGLGFGLVTQVLVIAVQNAVERRDLGTATASANFFRSLGGSVGVAVFGAVFAAGLTRWLPREVPGDAAKGLDSEALLAGPEQVRALAAPVRDGVADALAHALTPVFLTAAPIAALGLAAVLALREVPLQQRQGPPPGKAGPGKAQAGVANGTKGSTS
ncbi:MDR family MFS transporter [Streptomyces sp. NPDC002851]